LALCACFAGCAEASGATASANTIAPMSLMPILVL
jgi:hypothetical protein